MQLTKQSTQIHVGYEVLKQNADDKSGITCQHDTLSIKTPLWVLVITYNFSREKFHRLIKMMKENFQYEDDQMVPLEVTNHAFDFILITEAVTDSGKTFGDDEHDGHEVEIAEYLTSWVRQELGDDEREISGVGQFFSGCAYYEQILEDYVADNMDVVSISKESSNSEWYNVTINIGQLCFNFKMFEQYCS